MSRLLIAPLAFALALAVAPAAPVPKDRQDDFSFPTRAGTKWVYRLTIGKEEKSLTYVAKSAEATVDGRKAVWISLDDPKWASGGTMEVSEKGVFEQVAFPGGANLRPPVCLLQLPHRDGNKWETKTTVLDMIRTETRTAHGPELVEVPGGKYKAIRVESEYAHDGGKARKQTQWYASGIGLVKWVVRDEVWVLTAFHPAKE
jgi:hypothetical protein